MAAVTPVWRFLAVGALLPALAWFVGGSAQGRAAAPKLRMLDASPLRLAGSGFSPGERVRVRARTGLAKRSRRVRADSDGRFRVRFARLAQDPCSGSLAATATGSDGHRASLKHAQRQCPPSSDPPGGGSDEPPTPAPEPPPDPCLSGRRACPPAL